ncbi:hypothetical protein [Nocardioides alcanivorans]|uniref:hypothetical protein n=1 Tax=Nocardioides alcanivorans TaxID=2897352 RepID=UPI001F2B291D|nr:hypothetical protein [Nocardioides alcanivorans]
MGDLTNAKETDVRGKLGVLIGFGIGYVLGARAGHQRYEQILAKWQEVRENPRVQEAAEQAVGAVAEQAQHAREAASEVADHAQAVVKEKAGEVVDMAKEKARGHDSESTPLDSPDAR